MCPDISQYTHDEDGVEYPSAHDFYYCSNTHDLDQDGFHNLYHWDFIHALSQIARHKLSCHQLDPYQRATFQCGIIHWNISEEEADPVLETAMEYTGALSTIIFNESCCLQDLMEAQVGRNQFTMDVVVDWLNERIDKVDRRVNHASKCLSALEGKVMDMEAGYTELLVLGHEQVETLTRLCRALAGVRATLP